MKPRAILFLLCGLIIGISLGTFILFSGGYLPNTSPGTPNKSPVIGSHAPEFVVKSLSGEDIHLSDFLGKPVIINFWATWCTPCKDEMPLLETAFQKYNQKLVILGVDNRENNVVIQPYLQEWKIDFPIGIDEDGSVAAAYTVVGFPTTYFVDSQGILRNIHIGGLTNVSLEEYLKELGITH